jgi:hypothetical protein
MVIGKPGEVSAVEFQQAAPYQFGERLCRQVRIIQRLAYRLEHFLTRGIEPLLGLQIVSFPKSLGNDLGLDPHLSSLLRAAGIAAGIPLRGLPIMALHVVTDECGQFGIGNWARKLSCLQIFVVGT